MNKKCAIALSRLDPRFGTFIKSLPPIEFRQKRSKNPYEALVESVVYQQLTGRAAATIFARVKALYPDRRFPTPQEILDTPVERLRTAGLSQSKALSIHDIARKTLDGTIPPLRRISKMSEDEIVAHLTQVRGVGRWTVEMFLIFSLGREDVLPVTDYGIQKGFAQVFRKRKLPTPLLLSTYGERWKPYRTTAALYLWRAADLSRAQLETGK
ncbi:MAG: DNA-3-methyladenine glycosylase [Bdellovibrionales bacterium]